MGAVTLHTCARRKQTAVFSLNGWLKLIPQHITAPLTVHKPKVIKGCFIL
jgi:hypothetical protein